MRLLVKRDRNYLVEADGKAELDSDVPKELKNIRVVPQALINRQEKRSQKDDLLIANEEDYHPINEHFYSLDGNVPRNALPGIWSGYRSVLIRDNKLNRLFRLKGVSLNLEKPLIQDVSDKEYIVYGGQPKFAARFEKQMSDKLNKILENEGITPIMKCKGYWHYPKKIRNMPYSGSIIQVEGDTRLDELMLVLEQFFVYRTNAYNMTPDNNGIIEFKLNEKGTYVKKRISQLYNDIGMVVGSLKSLMDKNNQTWSADGERSNAHIGNVVLYNGSTDVKIGFVDFDASCDTADFSKSKIKNMQKREFETIQNSVYAPSISLRQIQAGFLRDQNSVGIFKGLRDAFVHGFSVGYDNQTNTPSTITNTIPFERFLEIFEFLRSGKRLSPKPVASFPDIGRKQDYFNPYNIMDKNNLYQDLLRGDSYVINKKDRDGLKDYLNNSFCKKNRSGLEDYLTQDYYL